MLDLSLACWPFNKFIKIADYFGLPLAAERWYTIDCITFLGIIMNSKRMEFYLTEEKNCKNEKLFLQAKKVTLRELQALLGLLVFMAMGRVFPKRLYKSPFAHIRLNEQMRGLKDPTTIHTALWREESLQQCRRFCRLWSLF